MLQGIHSVLEEQKYFAVYYDNDPLGKITKILDMEK
jgi:hypothetical protein